MSTVKVTATVAEEVLYRSVTMSLNIPDDAGIDVTDLDAVREWMDTNESDWVDDLDITTQEVGEREIEGLSFS
jgi:hypothetical protein